MIFILLFLSITIFATCAEIRRYRADKALKQKQWSEGNTAVFAAQDELKKAWESDNPAWAVSQATKNLIQKMIDQDKRSFR